MATNTPVARVAALQGQVFAQDEKGNLRQLKLDDPIYEGEVLVTGMGASVELAMQDGRTLNVPANETLTFDAEVAALEKPDATDSALLESGKSAEKIIQAVKEGGSLDELLLAFAGLLGEIHAEHGHARLALARKLLRA